MKKLFTAIRAAVMSSRWNTNNQLLGSQVRHPQMVFRMKLPRQVPPLSLLRRKAGLSP